MFKSLLVKSEFCEVTKPAGQADPLNVEGRSFYDGSLIRDTEGPVFAARSFSITPDDPAKGVWSHLNQLKVTAVAEPASKSSPIPRNMKLQRTNLLTLGAAWLLTMQAAVAAPVTTPSDGDIFLGVRASGGQGSGVSYIVNVGSDTSFRNAAPGSTLSLSNLSADLAATFGANWNTRADLYWGVFGARNNANPSVYSSRAQLPVGTPAADLNALSTAARVSTKNQIISVITAYQGLEATGNNPKAAVQTNNSSSGSYNQQVVGGTTSFGTLSQWTDIEGNFGAGAAGTALDLFWLYNTSSQGDLVNRVGAFTISSGGAVSFTAAPVLNQVQVKQINYAVAETAGDLTVTFVRSGDLTQAITANFTVSNGTALVGTDYTAPASLQVSFAASASESTVVIPVTNRTGYFGSRTFKVNLTSATAGFAVRAPASATVTISDVDPSSTVAFTQSAITVPQQTQGAPSVAALTITRSGVTTSSVSVQASVTGGTLVAGTHFTFTSPQTVTFLSGDTSKTLSIPLTANAVAGTIELTLASPQGGTALGGTTTATITVAPNAGTLAFSAASFSTSTAATLVNVTLNRTGGSEGAVSVDVSAGSATLVNGTNYTYTNPTTVNFAAGATSATTTVLLPAPSVGDIVLTLGNPTNFATLGAQSTTTVSIAGAPGAVSFAQAEFNAFEEVGVLSIPLVRTDGSTGPLSVTVTTAAGTAVSPGDFAPLNALPIEFTDGQTTASVPVTINLDAVKNEANETFTVTLAGESLGTITTATVRILDLDAVKPTVTITTPKANAKILESAGPSVVVTGTAKDNKGVAKIEVKINDGEFVTVSPLPAEVKGVINYSHTVTAEPGTNLITVRSTDYRNNVSVLVTRSFLYDDPYAAIAGTYTGLVSADDETTPVHATEGLVSVIIAAKGTFTGKLTLDGATHAITGSIPPSGEGQFGKTLDSVLTIVRKGKASLKLALQFDLRKAGNSNKVNGTVNVDGSAAASELVADRALYTAAKNPVLPLQNPSVQLWQKPYTILFKAPASGDASAVPQGDGWGTVTVSNAGVAKVTGTLADGTAVTFSAPLSITNQLPFYVPLYKNLGSISGPVKFEDLVATDVSAEDLYWFRPADAKSKVYPLGWAAGINVDLRGSKFTKAAKSDTSSILGFNGNGLLTFSQGTLTESLIKSFSITAAGKVTNANTDKTFTLTAAGATGIFSGTFTPPGQTRKPAFKGVVLQKSGETSGFFLSTATATVTSQSGKVSVSAANQ